MRGVFTVFGEREGRQTPVTADFSRWTFRRRLRKSQFSTTQKSDFQVRAIFGADRAYFAPLKTIERDFIRSKIAPLEPKKNVPGSAKIAPP